jgi:2-hydroxyisobutanoyl-CoA mutase large subunit
VALGRKRSLDLNKMSGTIQADILKEYMAQKESIYPIAPSVRIVRDCITYCAENMLRYNQINISGYHISEAGAASSPSASLASSSPKAWITCAGGY